MKVLLIDDHPLILSALQTIIQTLDDEIEVATDQPPQTTRARLRGEFVLRQAVLTDAQLLDAIAVGQVTPGPGSGKHGPCADPSSLS